MGVVCESGCAWVWCVRVGVHGCRCISKRNRKELDVS